jgi:hypothetical protein
VVWVEGLGLRLASPHHRPASRYILGGKSCFVTSAAGTGKSHWSRMGNIPTLWHPIGRAWGMFLLSGIPLVTTSAGFQVHPGREVLLRDGSGGHR